jgi:predicted dehydrogenase
VSSEPLRWGILGTGGIARKFVEGLQQVADRCPVVAVGSRSLDSAKTFAAAVPGCRAHGSYDALLADPTVEVVYVALLNHQHAEWCIKAAQAGKHVLCEKPAAMTATELERVFAAVRTAGTFFMEGFLYRCHPRWAKLRELIAGGIIGEVRRLDATFCFDGSAVRRLQERALGGGALMDVGCYPLSWLRWIAGSEPVATTCLAELNADGVDLTTSATLRFADGVLGTMTTSFVAHRHIGALVEGSLGRIDITEPWRSMPHESAFIVTTAKGSETFPTADDGLNTYAREALTVAKHIADRQAPAMTWNDSLGQARAMDALRHQAGVRWEGER